MPEEVRNIGTDGGAYIEGKVETRGGDFVGRDKIINNITQIKERALTAAEAADRAKEIARQRLAEAVTAYVERIGEIAADDQDALQGGPYRGLQAYTLREAEIFFGRDEAMADLLTHLQRGRLTILHAESGAGKSSLLQAGIQYQLIIQGHMPLYLRPYDKAPGQAIKQALLPGLDNLPELANASLRDYLHQVSAVLGVQTILVILIDQFEELFFTLNEEERQAFVAELAACLEDESLTVRWVLALRTEFFGNLANFRPRIRNPFENDFRLNRLPPEQARTVIEEPARRLGIDYEPILIDTLLADLRDPDSGEVTPAQLQLVCLALYNLLREQQQQDPAVPASITLTMYEAEGRTEGILRGHLNRVLRRTLNPKEREAARQLLIALVSSDQRRIRRTKSDLAATLSTYLTAAMSLDGLLDQLVDSRLLNVEEDEQTGEHSYELAHDYLVNEIEIDPELQARKAAQEMLVQEVALWQRNRNLRIPFDKLAIIDLHEDYLVKDDEAKTLLNLSRQARRLARLRQVGVVAGMIILPILAVLGVMSIFQIGLFAPSLIGKLDPVPEITQGGVFDMTWDQVGHLYVGYDGLGQIGRYDPVTGDWEILRLPGNGVDTILIDPREPERLYALPDGDVLQRSNNGGQTWEPIGLNIPTNDPISEAAVDPNGMLFASRQDGGIYTSSDEGETWQELAGAPPVVTHFLDWQNDRLLVGTEAGLWQWTAQQEWQELLPADQGVIFTAVSTPHGQYAVSSRGIILVDNMQLLSTEQLTSIAMVPGEPVLLIGSTIGGDLVWWRADQPEIQPLDSRDNLEISGYISSVQINPNNPAQLWVGTLHNLYQGSAAEWLADNQ